MNEFLQTVIAKITTSIDRDGFIRLQCGCCVEKLDFSEAITNSALEQAHSIGSVIACAITQCVSERIDLVA